MLPVLGNPSRNSILPDVAVEKALKAFSLDRPAKKTATPAADIPTETFAAYCALQVADTIVEKYFVPVTVLADPREIITSV
tara:strand:- start:269 stop:511 length:243 start_codon:yes stop_codon:yes gene_type:complete